MGRDSPQAEATSERRHWMAVLAKANWRALRALLATEELPAFEHLRRPETGLVMVRGRMGGTGPAFNVGEATVTRCSVRLADGTVGHAYVLGRSADHAEAAALCDALMQRPADRPGLRERIIVPLEAAAREQRENEGRKVAATKVDFFTMVRTRE